jgi:hypothetical protein
MTTNQRSVELAGVNLAGQNQVSGRILVAFSRSDWQPNSDVVST